MNFLASFLIHFQVYFSCCAEFLIRALAFALWFLQLEGAVMKCAAGVLSLVSPPRPTHGALFFFHQPFTCGTMLETGAECLAMLASIACPQLQVSPAKLRGKV